MNDKQFNCQLLKSSKNSHARVTKITTPHGSVLTPAFMPVGTRAFVNHMTPHDLKSVGSQIILGGNTYHMLLNPGMDIIRASGGMHRFMAWHGPMLTDSGGFQVFSLSKNAKICRIDAEGAHFKHPLTGQVIHLTPKSSIEAQRIIGADIIMAFDECTPPECTYSYAKESMGLTHRWLDRCINRFKNTNSEKRKYQVLFPIIQGSIYKDLRKISAETIAKADMPGNAIGGVCHPTGHLYEITEFVCDILPKEKPRYLMGVGTPKDLLECISLGVDMFDCVMPTRNGRNGTLFTTKGVINIRNKKWKFDFTPIDKDLGGYVSTHYSKAYLNHLFHVHEILGFQIASIHNLRFYLWIRSRVS